MYQIEFRLIEREVVEQPTNLPNGTAPDIPINNHQQEPEQVTLFSVEEITPWMTEWQNMPEYSHEDLQPRYQVLVSFACAADVAEFSRAIGKNITPNNSSRQTQSIWFPDQEIGHYMNKRYVVLDK